MKHISHVEPPHSLEIERRVIGALMFLGNHKLLPVQQAMLKLDSDSFYKMETKLVFEQIRERFNANREFDFVSLSAHVDSNSSAIFESLRDEYYTPNLLRSDVEELNRYRTLRKQFIILIDAVNHAIPETDPETALGIISENLQKLSQSSTAIADEWVKSYEQVIEEEFYSSEIDDSLIAVSIPDLPLVPNRALITIAGRSGHGKTFFAIYLLNQLMEAFPDKDSIYFNLEMHNRVMMDRIATLLGSTGKDSYERVKAYAAQILAKRGKIVSIPMITIDQIESISRIQALEKPLGVIVVDYLGLVTSKSRFDRKDLEQNNIAKRLAALSIELDCIVIALIQVNREFKTRPVGQRCPVPSDAAEAMGSVHSSSWWIGIDQPYQDNHDAEFQHVFQVKCRKNRLESGQFELNLEFRNGMFAKYRAPFGARYKPKDEIDPLIR